MLEVCDEEGKTLYLEDRKIIHQKGLLHREVHVWFFTPEREIIFQHRAKYKDTYPDLLDATVGGHVEPGDSLDQTAVKECAEETGLELGISDLIFVKNLRVTGLDKSTGMTNNVIRAQYVYLFSRDISELKLEEGKSQGFVKIPFDKLKNLSVEEKLKFIPHYYGSDYLQMFNEAVLKLGI